MRLPILVPCALWGVATLAAPPPVSAQGLHVFGYADLEMVVDDLDSDNAEFFFDNHHFNVIVLGKLAKNVFAAAEVEYEHAGEEIALEYGYISYTGLRNLKISAGKFIVPFGRFNKDLHPTWINKMPDRPHGFSAVLPQTYSDVGIWVAGGVPLGEQGMRLAYDAFVVNGLLGDEGASIRSMRDNSRDRLTDGGVDNNKAVGGRVGLEFPPQGFDVGVSVYTGNYLDDPDANQTLTLVGVDAAYVKDKLEVRAEGVLADQKVTGDNLKKKGGYAQIAYLVTPAFEPVFRFSMRDMEGADDTERRFSIGASYYISSTTAVRLAFHLNTESGTDVDNDRLIAQITTAF